MGTVPTPVPRQIAILVLDEAAQAGALKQILDSEGWRVRIVPDNKSVLVELKTGEYSLVIANIAILGLESHADLTLRELASVSVEDGGRMRILYVIPEMNGQFVGVLEMAKLPYVVRPFHLHDFLERVSDLLVEVKAIADPLRQVRREFGGLRKKKKEAGRVTSMFASRDSYSYTDEELAEYERSESESSKTKRRGPKTNLGGTDR